MLTWWVCLHPTLPSSHGVTPLLPAGLLAWMAGSAFERGGGQNPVFAPRYPPCRGSDLSYGSPGHLAAQAKAHLPRATHCSLGSRSRLRASFRHLQPGPQQLPPHWFWKIDYNCPKAQTIQWLLVALGIKCKLLTVTWKALCARPFVGGGTLHHSSPIQAQDSLPPSYPLNKPSSFLPRGLDAHYETVPGSRKPASGHLLSKWQLGVHAQLGEGTCGAQ